MFSLIKNQGWFVVPKHFIPPMIVNALLGTALWATYGGVYEHVDQYMGNHPIFSAAISGMAAGAAQAVIAAPAENVRLVIEGGSGGRSWAHAWKEVFRGTSSPSIHVQSKEYQMEEIRRLRIWMREVAGMAGQGWQGWGWGCAKDMCGFAAFFTVFEITRRLAVGVKMFSSTLVVSATEENSRLSHQVPRIAHALTLVSGGIAAGLAYEYVSIPWDQARKVVHTERTH
ncbi:hypothetical protein AX16_003766 [Volvariella volvacea WC 439]|nr:hypothetical protein AX16_003766 [Volvariella volvacea WC 439]